MRVTVIITLFRFHLASLHLWLSEGHVFNPKRATGGPRVKKISINGVQQGCPDRGPRAQIWAPDRLCLGTLGLKYMH